MSGLQELYVVLAGKADGSWSAFLRTNGAGHFFTTFVGKEGADKAAAELNQRHDFFEVFPLNSAEASEAIHGEKGIDFSKGGVPVDQDRFKLAAEPLMRYLSHTHHPHTRVIVDSTSAELLEGLCSHRTEKFLVD
jgi:hypothetical protein